jgi:hypothetical protein
MTRSLYDRAQRHSKPLLHNAQRAANSWPSYWSDVGRTQVLTEETRWRVNKETDIQWIVRFILLEPQFGFEIRLHFIFASHTVKT